MYTINQEDFHLVTEPFKDYSNLSSYKRYLSHLEFDTISYSFIAVYQGYITMETTTTSTPAYLEIPQVMFSWFDYTLFSGMLAISALIGIYFGCFGSKQNTTNEYLLGGKTMKVVPVAMSLIASNTSGIALLSVPADIYRFGATYIWITLSIIINSLVACYVFMPVFMKLQLTSTYEYLNLRFDNKIRTFASFLFALSIFLFNPIVIYVPALAFSQATGFNVHFITPIVCFICIFYTTIGGLKAVVWSDTLQTASIAVCMVVVFIMGIASAGGVLAVWDKSVTGHRLDVLDFNIDPTRRDSFWALVIGSTANWICNFCIHQATIQRCLAVPSASHAKKVILIFCIGIVLVKILSTFTGLIIFTKYSDCDPLATKQVLRSDQLLPYYVMDVAGKISGLPGLFIAGVFSAGLSTLSTTLNTLAATIYGDFVSPFMPADITQKQASNVLKLIVVISGIICTALVFVVEQLGGVLPLVISVSGITGGPLLGLFCLGMLCPMANAKGALYGGIGSLLFSSWMVFGNQWYKMNGLLKDIPKPLSTDGCNFVNNFTTTESTLPSTDDVPFVLYRISFWYFTFIGTVVTISLGLTVSWFTNKDDPPVHPDLISPVAQFLLPKGKFFVAPPKYYSVDKALNLVTINFEKELEVNIQNCENNVDTSKQ